MGQPLPPGDNVPLYEGLDASWNDIVGAFPEDRRAELAPKLKDRISAYEPLKPWEDFSKAGITPDHVRNAIDVFNAVERNPREVYEAIGRELGISAQEVKEVAEELEDEGDNEDPRIKALQEQFNTLAQITLTERQQKQASAAAEAADAKLNQEINALKNKYGNDIPEDEILMRMGYKNLSAEEAYQEYAARTADIQKRRPAPFVMGGSGAIPQKGIDPTKLSGEDTRSLVAQMMARGAYESKQ